MRIHWPHIKAMLDATEARTIIEIGGGGGATTQHLLGWADEHDAVVHSIDPNPALDADAILAAHPGRFVFHRTTSFDVLPSLPQADLVCLDGDHNWYTVFNELRLLDESAQRAGRPFPLTLLHDIGWPYGRRDQYYDPNRIPDEFRQEYSSGAGMLPGRRKTVEGRGYNYRHKQAILEGGPRNGVLTGAEDYVKECARDLRMETVAGGNGLAVIADNSVLEANPALREQVDLLVSPEFLQAHAWHLDELANKYLVARVMDRLEITRLQNRVKELEVEAASRLGELEDEPESVPTS